MIFIYKYTSIALIAFSLFNAPAFAISKNIKSNGYRLFDDLLTRCVYYLFDEANLLDCKNVVFSSCVANKKEHLPDWVNCMNKEIALWKTAPQKIYQTFVIYRQKGYKIESTYKDLLELQKRQDSDQYGICNSKNSSLNSNDKVKNRLLCIRDIDAAAAIKYLVGLYDGRKFINHKRLIDFIKASDAPEPIKQIFSDGSYFLHLFRNDGDNIFSLAPVKPCVLKEKCLIYFFTEPIRGSFFARPTKVDDSISFVGSYFGKVEDIYSLDRGKSDLGCVETCSFRISDICVIHK